MKIMLLILFSLSLLYAELNYWPQQGANSRHISHIDLDGPHEKPEIAWTYKIECAGWSPVFTGGVVTDTLGNSYITAYPEEQAITSCFFSLDMNGKLRWKKEYKDNPWFSSPIIDLNKNRIYLSSTHYTMHLSAYNFDGNQLWTTTMCGMPVLGENGILYLSSDAYYALDSDGNMLWQTEKLDEIGEFLPAVDTDGTSYVMGDSVLYRISNQGQVDWKIVLNKPYYMTKSVCIGDSCIFWGTDISLVCFRKSDGSDKWTYSFPQHCQSVEDYFPTITNNGDVLMIGQDYVVNLYSLKQDGSLNFKAYASNSTVAIEDKSYYIYSIPPCYDKNGNKAWDVVDMQVGADKIAMDKFGRLIVGCYDSQFPLYYIACLRSTNKFSNKSSSSYIPSPSLSAHPNPFKDRLTIEVTDKAKVYTITGQLIMNLSKGKHSLDTSSWREGVYIVKSGKEIKRMIKIN